MGEKFNDLVGLAKAALLSGPAVVIGISGNSIGSNCIGMAAEVADEVFTDEDHVEVLRELVLSGFLLRLERGELDTVRTPEDPDKNSDRGDSGEVSVAQVVRGVTRLAVIQTLNEDPIAVQVSEENWQVYMATTADQ